MKVYDEEGADVKAQSHWAAVNVSVVEVQADVTIAAKATGTTEITVTYGGATRVYSVEVYSKKIAPSVRKRAT